jgi:hypothetical protein
MGYRCSNVLLATKIAKCLLTILRSLHEFKKLLKQRHRRARGWETAANELKASLSALRRAQSLASTTAAALCTQRFLSYKVRLRFRSWLQDLQKRATAGITENLVSVSPAADHAAITQCRPVAGALDVGLARANVEFAGRVPTK